MGVNALLWSCSNLQSPSSCQLDIAHWCLIRCLFNPFRQSPKFFKVWNSRYLNTTKLLNCDANPVFRIVYLALLKKKYYFRKSRGKSYISSRCKFILEIWYSSGDDPSNFFFTCLFLRSGGSVLQNTRTLLGGNIFSAKTFSECTLGCFSNSTWVDNVSNSKKYAARAKAIINYEELRGK